MTRIDEIRERLDKATPGPWEADGSSIAQHWSRPGPWEEVVSTEVDCMAYCYGGSAQGVIHESDADLIANAPADLAWCIEYIDELERVLRDEGFDPTYFTPENLT